MKLVHSEVEKVNDGSGARPVSGPPNGYIRADGLGDSLR
jgi:hypothetical protein